MRSFRENASKEDNARGADGVGATCYAWLRELLLLWIALMALLLALLVVLVIFAVVVVLYYWVMSRWLD